MIQKPQILIILQNFYTSRTGKRRRLKFPIYDTRIINRKNATYSRIVPYLENHFELFFTECTPMVGYDHKEKFDTDLEWLSKAVNDREWYAIIAFGQQAQEACGELNSSDFIFLPHPVSFKWRKSLLLETIEQIKPKNNDE